MKRLITLMALLISGIIWAGPPELPKNYDLMEKIMKGEVEEPCANEVCFVF